MGLEAALSRFIFIGDIHGCLAELDDLIGELDLQDDDRLAFVGDFVDRGPDTVGCVRRVRELMASHPGSLAVCGNHEEKWLRYRERDRELPEWAADATDDDWAFLDGLPLLVSVPEVKAVVVHAGFFPAFFEQYDRLGEVTATWRTDRDKRSKRMRRFLRVRKVDANGQMVALDKTLLEHRHWSQLYDGREGYCFFGHDPQIEPPEVLRAPHALGIDTGCCFGGRLTAAVVEVGSPPQDARLVSVPARAQYAEPLRLHPS